MGFLKVLLELILMGMLGAGVYLGIRYGFISIMAKPVKLFAAIFLAFGLAKGFAAVFVTPIIEAPITNYVTDFLYENCSGLTAVNAADELPTLLKIAAAVFNIDISSVAAEAGSDIINEIVRTLALPVINVIAVVISFVLVYFLAKLLFTLALHLVNVFFKGGILGKINKSLGIVFGTCIAFIGAWIFAGFLEFIFNTPLFNEAMAGFRGGLLYRFFNSFSPIELLLSF